MIPIGSGYRPGRARSHALNLVAGAGGAAGVFERAAPILGRVGPTLFSHYGRRLVQVAGLQPRGRVLDVAAGAGAVLLPAAERVGPDGHVVGVDLAAGGPARAARTWRTPESPPRGRPARWAPSVGTSRPPPAACRKRPAGGQARPRRTHRSVGGGRGAERRPRSLVTCATAACASIGTDGRPCVPVTWRRSALACHSAAGCPVLRARGERWPSRGVRRVPLPLADSQRASGPPSRGRTRYGRCDLACVLRAAAAAATAAAWVLAQPRRHHRRRRLLRARQRDLAAARRRQLRRRRLPGAAGRGAPPARDRGGGAARPPARRPLAAPLADQPVRLRRHLRRPRDRAGGRRARPGGPPRGARHRPGDRAGLPRRGPRAAAVGPRRAGRLGPGGVRPLRRGPAPRAGRPLRRRDGHRGGAGRHPRRPRATDRRGGARLPGRGAAADDARRRTGPGPGPRSAGVLVVAAVRRRLPRGGARHPAGGGHRGLRVPRLAAAARGHADRHPWAVPGGERAGQAPVPGGHVRPSPGPPDRLSGLPCACGPAGGCLPPSRSAGGLPAVTLTTAPLAPRPRKQVSMARPYQIKEGTRRLVLLAVAVHMAIVLCLGALRLAGTEAALRRVDWPGTAALALAFALPAFLGLLALRGRPAALLAAGLLSLVLSVIAVSVVALALLLPAVLYLGGSARSAARAGRGPARFGLIASVVLAGVAAFAVLLWPPQASYSWSLTADGGVRTTRVQRCSGGTEQRIEPPGRGPGGATTVEQGCSDGVIPPGHAGVSVVVAAVALAAGLRLPRQPTPGQ